jgi:Acetyltransferase (GNAT) domain
MDKFQSSSLDFNRQTVEPGERLTSTISMDRMSKLQMLRQWGREIDPRELYIVSSCVEWIKSFPSRDGNEGPRLNSSIHPCVVNAIETRNLYFTVALIQDEYSDLARIDNILREGAALFKSLVVENKDVCLALVMPNLNGKSLFTAVDPDREIKDELLRGKVFVGEYYQSCPFETNFDPSSYAMYSPATLVVFREFTESDWEFVWRVPKWGSVYRELFGEPNPKYIVQNSGDEIGADEISSKKIRKNAARGHHDPVKSILETELEVLTTTKSLARFRNSWEELAATKPGPFTGFDANYLWFETTCTHDYKPLIFVLRRQGQVIAIWACYQDGKTIRAAADEVGDCQDVIAANQEDAAELLRHAVVWLAENQPRSSLNLSKCRAGGFIHQCVAGNEIPLKIATISSRVVGGFTQVNISEKFDLFIKKVPDPHKALIMGALDNLSVDQREFSFEILRDAPMEAGKWNEIVDFYVINSKDESPLRKPAFCSFLKKLSDLLNSGLQISKLCVDGVLIAAEMGFAKHGIYTSFLSCFNQEFASYFPVTCLLACRIDDLVENDGIQTLLWNSRLDATHQTFGNGHTETIHSHRIFPLRNKIQMGTEWIARKAREITGRK